MFHPDIQSAEESRSRYGHLEMLHTDTDRIPGCPDFQSKLLYTLKLTARKPGEDKFKSITVRFKVQDPEQSPEV